MKTIALYHLKGGVGKTTSTVNLAYEAAFAGNRTLIIDLDPQSAATYYFRIKARHKKGVKRLTGVSDKIVNGIKATDFSNLDLLPATFSYRKLDRALMESKQPLKQLRRALSPLASSYDIIMLDCPPSITAGAEAVFYAADLLLVPMIPTTLSVRSYHQLLNYLQKNDQRCRIGAFFSMSEKRKSMHQNIINSLGNEDENIFETIIPLRSIIEKMGTERAPVSSFAPSSVEARLYRNLWYEIALYLENSVKS